MQTPTLDLSYVNASRLLLPSAEMVALVLVGCGGTGSWLAPSVVRVARLLTEKQHKQVRVFFVDPDRVEPKNCYRQNFCEAEVGRNKAETLAFRYGLGWGVDVMAVPDSFGPSNFATNGEKPLVVCIGCVDNAQARGNISTSISNLYMADQRAWWLDCGNHQLSGQVLIGSGGPRPKDPFQLPGYCAWLPKPSDRHPELLEPEPEAARDETALSCADMALADSQGLAINQRIAAEATDYLVRMLVTRDLQKLASYIDLASGSTRSLYITRENVRIDNVSMETRSPELGERENEPVAE